MKKEIRVKLTHFEAEGDAVIMNWNDEIKTVRMNKWRPETLRRGDIAKGINPGNIEVKCMLEALVTTWGCYEHGAKVFHNIQLFKRPKYADTL